MWTRKFLSCGLRYRVFGCSGRELESYPYSLFLTGEGRSSALLYVFYFLFQETHFLMGLRLISKMSFVLICYKCMQARSQKFAMGGAGWGVWGRSPQPLEANGGLGAKPPAAGGWGFGGKAPSRRRHGVWGGAPSARKFCIFLQK